MRRKLHLLVLPALMFIFFTPLFGSFSKEKTSVPQQEVSRNPNADISKGLNDFKSLSKSERRERVKEMKKALKDFKADKKEGKDVSTNTLLLVLIGILIPPLAVYLLDGEINNRFWISVLLTILGYLLFGFAGIFFLGSLPGIIYALILILGNS